MPIHRLSDSRLVRRSQQGDRDAFLALLERYDHRLRGLAYALVTSEAGMERVLRTSYVRAWREVVRADADDDAGTWLYRVTYNTCIDELRRERARLDGPEDPAVAPSSGADAADADDPLVQALAALPPERRLAVVLVDREGFTPAGAARIAGMAQEAFDERLAAGRAALVAALPTAAPRRRNPPGGHRRRPGGPGAQRRPGGPPAPGTPAAPGAAPSPAAGTPVAEVPAEAPPAEAPAGEPAAAVERAPIVEPVAEATPEATPAAEPAAAEVPVVAAVPETSADTPPEAPADAEVPAPDDATARSASG